MNNDRLNEYPLSLALDDVGDVGLSAFLCGGATSMEVLGTDVVSRVRLGGPGRSDVEVPADAAALSRSCEKRTLGASLPRGSVVEEDIAFEAIALLSGGGLLFSFYPILQS